MTVTFSVGERSTRVRFQVEVTPGEESVTSGPPENWYPGSDAEVEIVNAWIERGMGLASRLRRIDADTLFERHPGLYKRVADAVCEAAADAEECARDDAADARRARARGELE